MSASKRDRKTPGKAALAPNKEPVAQPSNSAATAAGSVGPAAVAAAEQSHETSMATGPSIAVESSDGLSEEDKNTLQRLAQQVGGTDALIRWLQLHASGK